MTGDGESQIETGLRIAAGEMDNKELLKWFLRHN